MSTSDASSRPKSIASVLALALVAGVLVGLVDGWLELRSQRYDALGFRRLSLESLRSAANLSAARVLLGVAGLSLGFLGLRALFSGSGLRHGAERAWWTVVALVAVGGALAVGYHLNRSPDYPSFFSLAGLLGNAAIVLGFAAVGGLAAWAPRRPGVRRVAQTLRGRPAYGAGVAALALLAALNGFAQLGFGRPPDTARNILLVTADTLRHDHLGSYGYARDTSPNLDGLAARGVRFEHAVVQWPKTSPSFASLLTSLYGHQTGVIRYSSQPLPARHLAVAELLREQGYSTFGVVTNGNLARGYQFDQGFEHYVEIWREHPEQDAEFVSDAALDWLRDHAARGDGPFFGWLHYVDPHAFYRAPPPYRESFVGDPHYRGDRHAPLNEDRDADMGGIPGRARLGDRTDLDYYVAEYDAEIRYMDEHIGRVLDGLRELGLEDDTIVLFTADHGESLGDHDYYFEHGRLAYDASSRVPALVAGPGVPSGRVVTQAVELIDVVPTLLDLAGMPAHPEAEGSSWRGLIEGDEAAGKAYAYTEAGYRSTPQRALRWGRWKLIHVPDPEDQAIMQGSPFELYDLEADPGETRNLIDVEKQVAETLSRKLMERAGSPVPSEAPAPRELPVDDATEEALRALGYIE